MTSTQLKFQNLYNTRDLGGIKTANGLTIKKGLLFRSGQLSGASETDINALESLHIGTIYDFRSIEEQNEKPDPVIAGTEHISLPILEDMAPGISREAAAENDMISYSIREIQKDVLFARKAMLSSYTSFVNSSYSQERYSIFLKGLVQTDAPVLWHCTAGKDRAGFATVLVLIALGTDLGTIKEDYLYTNECLSHDMNALKALVLSKISLPEDNIESVIMDFLGAREEYFDVITAAIGKTQKDQTEFLNNKLKLTESDLSILREKYLY